MTVPVYTFDLSVICTKMIKRDGNGVAARYSDANRQIDITPYLGEAGSVKTVKALTQCAGAFEISFGDRMDPIEDSSQDSLYARIEPMDMIEIRASRYPFDYTGTDLPLIMRGFVDVVRRNESIGDDGRPRRNVIITGHDFGKLWEIHQVFWELLSAQEQPMLTAFQLQTALGIPIAIIGVSEFVRIMVEKVMNARIADLEVFSQQSVKRFITEASVEQGNVIPSRVGEIEDTTYWGVLTTFADRPWNELFIRDEEDGPHVIFREAPYKGVDGKLIMPYATDPGMVEVDISEVINLDVGRADARVANFFWTPPGSSSLDSNGYAVAGSLQDGSALDFHHGNNIPEVYGFRKMTVQTALQPTDATDLPARLPAGQQQNAADLYIPWYRLRAQQIQAMNRDNSVFEDGGMSVMGREDYTIGRYLQLTRGNLISEAYIVAVSHIWQPLNAWTTSVQLERGNGFLVRLQVADSPYLAENRTGPYS